MTDVISTRPKRRIRTRLPSDWGGRIGLFLAIIVVAIALFGRFFAPYNPDLIVCIPGTGPVAGHLLGCDFEGRDVLGRLLYGGLTTLLLGLAATVLTYLVGVTVGLVAGFSRNMLDPLIMRLVDVVLSLPSLLVILLAITAFGSRLVVLVCAAALVMIPGVARIVRSATLEVSQVGFVEAAVARGERTGAILRREILPNIMPSIVADLGLRFSWGIILIASVNFLGLGIAPPTPDWGVMISENRAIISTNPIAVIAPALCLGVLVIAVNLTGDSFVRRLGRSKDT